PHHPDLHSFPTRRSSDLNLTNGVAVKATGGAQDGDNFVRLQNRTQASGNNNLGLQDVAVTPGATYTVSYWYKSASETFNFKHWIDRKSTRLNSSHVKISY